MPRPRLLKLSILVVAAALAACARQHTPVQTFDAPPSAGLPALASLRLDPQQRAVSSADYSLLADAPVASAGAAYDGTSVELSPEGQPANLAMAVFGLGGFPTDGTLVPESVRAEKNAFAWLGLANFASGHWELTPLPLSPGTVTYENGADYVSPDGGVFVALVGYASGPNPSGQSTCTELTLTVSDTLPGSPVAQINVLSDAVTGLPVYFDAIGSTGGNGTITALTWDFGEGSPVVTTDPAEEVSHVYSSTGVRTVSLTVENNLGMSSEANVLVTSALPFRELIVVYNTDIPESLDLAEYYASARYGRAIDPAQVTGFAMGAAEEVPRAAYESTVRDPIRAFLVDSGLKDTIKYIVLVKGVPYKISGSGGGNPDIPTYSAVDSELCTLYSDGLYPYEGRLYSGTKYPTLVNDYFTNSGFYEGNDGADRDFAAFTYDVVDVNNQTYKLDYLVSRISAYTWDEAKLSIDRSLAADTSGTGTVLIDSIEGRWPLDTMTDPVWPSNNNDTYKCLWEHLDDAGYASYKDLTSSTIQLADLDPPSLGQNVIAYTGWGTNHGGEGYVNGKLYIQEDLGFTYLPGAAWIVYESFAGTQFTWDDTPDGHAFQGQIADFIRAGGTVAIGNCYEPWSDAVGDERRMLERYLIHGDRWIEAAYKGMRYFSWTTIVLGDPLCRVK